MTRLATITWRSGPPAAIDEELALFDDGVAWLVLRTPRRAAGMVGTFATRPGPADLEALGGAGPGPHAFDLAGGPQDAATAALRAVADRVAAAALGTPRAAARFEAGTLGPVAGGRLSMAILVTGAGTRAVRFELDPARCTVHFASADRQPVAWFPLPELGSGFVTPDAEGLGGLRRRARVRPGGLGATAFEIAAPGAAATVAIEVAGRLEEGPPDERAPRPFSVRTAPAPIPGAASVSPGQTP